MSYEENSRSEQGKNNWGTLTGTEKARYISVVKSNQISSDIYSKKTEKKLKEREEKMGRSKDIPQLIKEGMNARFNAIPYDASKFEDSKKQAAYYEGFYIQGSRLIYANLDTLSEEQLKKIGENDYISGVKPEDTFPKIKENIAYTQGYIMASRFDNEKRKHR